MLRQGFDNDSIEFIIKGFKESAKKLREGTYQTFDKGIEKGFDISFIKGAVYSALFLFIRIIFIAVLTRNF